MATLIAPSAGTGTSPPPARAALRQIGDLPGPPGLPWLGNTLQTRVPRLHLDIERWAREHGPLFRFHVGPVRALGVSDHRLITELLRDRPHRFRRAVIMSEISAEIGLKTGLFHAEGQAWQNQRRMVMSAFSPANVRAYFPALLKVAHRLDARWRAAAARHARLELLPELMRFTVDVISGLAFGTDTNTLGSDEDIIQAHLDKIFPVVSARMAAPVPYWRYIQLPADRALAHSVPFVNRAVDEFVAQARARLKTQPALRERPGNLLEAMIVAADQPDSGVNDDDVAGNVLTMLLAGEDTTAGTIAWMVHLLHRHPQALQRARDEVCATVRKPGDLTPERLAAMPYLEACAHETMRLKPVAPLNPLQALEDTVIGDVHVPAGTFVSCVMRADALDEGHFTHAATFHPERWLADGAGDAGAAHGKRVSMPFGAGPRICPGRYLALLEIKVAMATLLAGFDIESVHCPDGDAPREIMAFTMHPGAMFVRLRARC